MLIRVCLFLFVFLNQDLGVSQTSKQNSEVLLDRVLALVNGQPIFHSDIQRKIRLGPSITLSEYPSTTASTEFERSLNDSINQELVKSAARNLDLDLSEAEVDTEIDRYIAQQDITREKLTQLLKEQNETFENYRRDFKTQLLIRKFQRRILSQNIQITEKDIETYYFANYAETASQSTEVDLMQISLKIEPSGNSQIDQARSKLVEEVKSKLKAGLNFEDAIGLYSDRAKTETGKPDSNRNVVVTVRTKDLASDLRSQIETLKVGEVMGPYFTQGTQNFFKLIDRRVIASKEFLSKRSEIEQTIRTNQLKSQMDRWLSDQRSRSSVTLVTH
jgi:parvulin-like peptidyl-prolyl isomerase